MTFDERVKAYLSYSETWKISEAVDDMQWRSPSLGLVCPVVFTGSIIPQRGVGYCIVILQWQFPRPLNNNDNTHDLLHEVLRAYNKH